VRALVIHHDHITSPGAVGERLVDRGYDLVLHQVVEADRFGAPDVETEFPQPIDFDVIVAMGAPWSAYDHVRIGTWVLPELDLLRRADESGVPVLGVCFGGQLLALAHGGSVARSPAPELGWIEVVSDDEALVRSGPWFEWHYDRWQLPAAATEIARNPQSSQAFVLGRNLAVQFHPEMTPTILAGWLDAGGSADVEDLGLDADSLLQDTRDWDAENRIRTHRLVDGFLDRVATSASELTERGRGTPGRAS
jgi:GMP synthase-like glutamine amidotransferase